MPIQYQLKCDFNYYRNVIDIKNDQSAIL